MTNDIKSHLFQVWTYSLLGIGVLLVITGICILHINIIATLSLSPNHANTVIFFKRCEGVLNVV